MQLNASSFAEVANYRLMSSWTGSDVSVDARHVVKMGATAGTQQNGHVRLRRCAVVVVPFLHIK